MPAITLEATLPHYTAVGRVAATWAAFEHDVQLLIWGRAGVEQEIGACMTTQIGGSGRMLDALISLMELHGATDDHLTAMRSFAEKVGRKQRRRNRIVHDPWYFRFQDDGSAKPLRMEISAAKKLVYEAKDDETTKSINEFVKEIQSLSSELDVTYRSSPLNAFPYKRAPPSAKEREDQSP